MKKLFLFAAAILCLVACNNKDNALNNAPEGTPFAQGQKVTLTVSHGNESSQTSARMISGKDTGSTFTFKWEENDSILVKVGEKSAVFHIKNSTISADSTSADFEGVMPKESSTYDVQYPVQTDTDPLENQTYVEGGIANGLMQFGAEGCTSSKITLVPKTAILQLNFYTTAETIGEELGDPIKLGALTKIQLVYESEGEDFFDNLVIGDPGVELETSADKAKPFYIVVRTGVKYKKIIIHAGNTPDKSSPELKGRTFEAGTCINMPAWQVYDTKTCLAAGTRITMADGSTKKVEDIVVYIIMQKYTR